jgi:hypothetical protein
VHGDAFSGEVDDIDPGADEGDQNGLVVGAVGDCGFGGDEGDGEERGGVGHALTVGSRGELDSGDDAYGCAVVEQGTADEIADEVGVGIEWGKRGGRREELAAGEGFGFIDGVAVVELEHPATGVAAGGLPAGLDGTRADAFDGDGGAGSGEPKLAAGREELCLVGERLGEELAATALRPQEASHRHPRAGRRLVHRRLGWRQAG